MVGLQKGEKTKTKSTLWFHLDTFHRPSNSADVCECTREKREEGTACPSPSLRDRMSYEPPIQDLAFSQVEETMITRSRPDIVFDFQPVYWNKPNSRSK